MADNVPITPGSGKDIATDDVSGAHFQKVKLDVGGDGASAPVVGTVPVSGTVTAAAQPGTDIGDVTVNNAAGAAAVNIQDGGNTITVDATTLPLPTGASTIAEQQTQTVALQLIDDAVHADGAAQGKSLLMAGRRDDTAPTIAEDTVAALRMTSKQALMVNLRDSTGVELGAATPLVVGDGGMNLSVDDGSGSLTVDSSQLPTSLVSGRLDVVIGAALPSGTQNIGDVDVASVVPGTGSTNLGKAEDAAHASGDTGVMILGVRNDTPSSLAANGDYIPISTDSAGRVGITGLGNNLNVSLVTTPVQIADDGGSLTVDDGGTTLSIDDGAGTLTVDQATAANLNAQVVGNVAHDATDSGNPVKIGAKAIAHGANPAAVLAAERTDLYANRHGILFCMGGHPNAFCISVRTINAAQTGLELLACPAGGKIVVTRVTMSLSRTEGSTADGVACRVGFSSTTTLATMNTTPNTTIVASHPGIPAGGGLTVGDGSGILGIGATDADLRVTTEATSAAGFGLDITVTGFTIES
jgi:hypothetical protein